MANSLTPMNVHGSTNGNAHNEQQSTQSFSESYDQKTIQETKTISTSSMIKTEERVHFANDQQVTVLRDTVIETRRRFVAEFPHVDEHYIGSITIGGFIGQIERERLTHMPHQGSKWDRVLKWAEFFALQVSMYEGAVCSFVPDSKLASKLILSASRVLLEVGHGNAAALEITFGAFYKLGLSISFFLRHNSLLHVNAHLRNEVGCAFRDMLVLVSDVTVTYRNKIRDISFGPVRLDFDELFGRQMEAFSSRKNHIVNAMWQHQLGNEASNNIGEIRKWLKPQDKTIRDVQNNRIENLDDRVEYTCEWFQRHLLDFSRGKNDVLLITGPEGSGKTVLWGWIVERLQRPLAKKNFITLQYSIYTDLPTEATPVAIAKSLALQLLETNVGDKKLFEKLSGAYDLSLTSSDLARVEAELWDALEAGLKTVDATSDSLMIIIDGLDEIGEHSQRVLHRFEALGKSHRSLQTILLARAMLSTNMATQVVEIRMDHTHSDMEHVVEHALQSFSGFKDQDEFNREKVVNQIVHNAQGNFLWAVLAVALLKKEQSHAAFMKALNEMPKTSRELVKKIVSTMDLQKPDTKLLIQWLLVAKRPLTLAEVHSLYRVDVQKRTMIDRRTDVREDITRACGLLVSVQDGIVSYRHNAIRAHFSNMMAEKAQILPWADAQEDMTMRLLTYCKLSLAKPYQPVFEIPGTFDTEEIFRAHALLEYIARYWILHFEASSPNKHSEKIQISSELKVAFPSSVGLALLEWKCWEYQTSLAQAVTWLDLALRIRQAVYTEKHESVLQTLIVCGKFHKRLLNAKEASTCFYRASSIGQEVVPKYSEVTISCTTAFLNLTETIAIKSRTEVATQKEQMLKYIIGASRYKYGKTSEIVIQYSRTLAQLYLDIHEEQHAEEIWKELREIAILRHGKGSEEEKEISKNLVIILKKDQKKEDLVEYEHSIFETITTMEVWDARRIKMTFELAMSYEARGEFFLAEELYVQLWRRLTEYCHQALYNHGVEIHISVIDVAVEYVRFLRRQSRHQEAAGILICIWNEYEDYEFESETVFIRLKTIGELMRSASLLEMAVSVFRKCWTWFKFHGKLEHEASCEVLISETLEEITTMTVTSITSTTTTTTVSKKAEMITREVFESTLSKKVVTKDAVTICKNLISMRMKLEQWAEAIDVTERSLVLIWKMIISGNGIIALPRHFDSEAIDIAIGLAICHSRLHHFHEAEEIYTRIYHACRISCRIDNERLVRSYKVLIKFYEEHRRWQKMINIYQELLVEYQVHLGASHALTIETLYLLGSLCAEHGHGNALAYYEEVVTVLNGKNRVCHKDGKDSMIILCRLYYEDGQWNKLLDVCRVLWETLLHHHKEFKFQAEFIEVLYQRYLYVIEFHQNCEYEVVRNLTIQYRDICLKAFGTFSIYTIKAMLELAKICLRSGKHLTEAISIYEEVIQKTTTTTTTTSTTTTISITTMTTVKESLSRAYIQVCSHESASTATIERATRVLVDRFEHLKIKLGCAHSDTLAVLSELLLLYKKLKTQESNATIVRMLTSVSIEVITKEKHSVTLHDAALTLGNLFLSLDLAKTGIEIVAEMRKQILFGKSTGKNKLGLNIQGKVGRSSYIFVVTLERVLRTSLAVSYSEIMSEMLIETTLYEHYNMCLKSDTEISVVLIHNANLRAFLFAKDCFDQVELLENQAFDIFIKKWGSTFSKAVTKEVIRVYLHGLLIQLGIDGRDAQFDKSASIASVDTVKSLLQEASFKAAFEVAQCSFEFLNQQGAHHHLENIPYLFKLSGLLAGLEISFHGNGPEPELYQQMLKLSQSIIREGFKILKESNIDIIRLKPEDLDSIVTLLGAQKNYADLEWLLKSLWLSREVHKTWNRDMIISVGRLLALAYSLSGNYRAAIKICEDICYNLRRVWGSLHPESLKMEELLSEIYTAAGHYREAMGVHEDVLRLIIEGDDGDDRTVDIVEPEMARRHLDLLKASYLRLKGWDKSAANYHELVREMLNMREYNGHAAFKDAVPADKWSLKEDPGSLGLLAAPLEWRFLGSPPMDTDLRVSVARGMTSRTGHSSSRPRMGLKRASSNWGLGFLHDLLHSHHDGDDDEAEEEEKPRMPTARFHHQNGNGAVTGKA